MTTEATPLLEEPSTETGNAKAGSTMTSVLLLSIQFGALAFFILGTTYSLDSFSQTEYQIFRDVMVMLLLGFGYLMTFLSNYGLGAVGFTMLLTAVTMQLNIPVELLCRYIYGESGEDTAWPLPLQVSTFIDAEFAAATFLISYGAVIGRASPVHLIIMALIQSFCYALNKVIFVLGLIGAEDVGGTITIHMFGAYFGLAASMALGPPEVGSASNASSSHISDVFAMVGTTLLWVYWPSFVGATETGTEWYEDRCILHTILALLGSTLSSFYLSQQLCDGKYDPVHIANSTLAGGVAVGASARLDMTPGGALVLGVLAGIVSVNGYQFSSPMFESKLKIFDTCGVGNLHGWPSILGGLASIIFVIIDSEAAFLEYSTVSQCLRQLLAVVVTLLFSTTSGFATGKLMLAAASHFPDEYDDALWWEGSYYEHED